MHPPALALCCALALGLTAPAALAADLSPEQVAKIRREQKAALKKIDQAHGNKKPSELSNDERRQIAEERAAAERQVLDKHGVEVKEFANHTVRMGTEERKAAAAAEEKLEAAEKKKSEAAAAKEAAGSKEIPIQQGFDEENPVDLEESDDAQPKVEYGPVTE